ncbi:MAG TPA: hypothetical protein VJ440_06300, partial [Candidatus Brocadiaceae bacterium]|nr:hypothetical protein [Candidatus Brocadiaceae bacterium]
MLLYLDMNCFNRPFDDQSQDRIVRETTAVFAILQRIVDGIDRLAWSVILDFENSRHPLMDRRTEIARWALHAVVNIAIDERVSGLAQELTNAGCKALDAAHFACAEVAACDYFLTCDDQLLRQARRLNLALR